MSYSVADHEHLIDVLTAFIQYDGFEAGRLMATHSSEAGHPGGSYEDDLVDLDGFCSKIKTMVELIRISPSARPRANPGDLAPCCSHPILSPYTILKEPPLRSCVHCCSPHRPDRPLRLHHL